MSIIGILLLNPISGDQRMNMSGNGIIQHHHINGEKNLDLTIQLNMSNIGILKQILINGGRDRVNRITMMMDNMNTIGIIILNLIKQGRNKHQISKENMNIIGTVQLNHIRLGKNLQQQQLLHHHLVQLTMNNIGMLVRILINGGLFQVVIVIMMANMSTIGIMIPNLIKLGRSKEEKQDNLLNQMELIHIQ